MRSATTSPAGSDAGLDEYSDRCLTRVWRAQHFSWWMTTMLHLDPHDDAYGRQLQRSQLRYVHTSTAAATSLAENYVGLPLEQTAALAAVMHMAEITTLREAIAELVHDGDAVAIEGFTHLIPFAAGHEILRQGRRELELIRMTPDILYDQMIGVGAARKLVFSYGGNPGRRLAAPLPRRRRARLAARRSSSRSTATPAWPTATPPAPRGCRSR